MSMSPDNRREADATSAEDVVTRQNLFAMINTGISITWKGIIIC